MKIVCGLCFLNIIIQTAAAMVALQRQLFVTTRRCGSCNNPTQVVPGQTPFSLATLQQQLKPTYFPVNSGQRNENIDESPQLEITRENEWSYNKRFPAQKSSEQLMRRFLEHRRSLGISRDRQETTTPRSDDSKTDRDDTVDNNKTERRVSDEKALECSKIECGLEDMKGPVCACNFKTGNTVSFKNECDIKKHNCRFDTGFKTILDDVCPWQFESRSAAKEEDEMRISYKDSRYY